MAVKIYVSEKQPDVAPGAALPKTARVLLPSGKGNYRLRRIPTDVVWHAPAEFLAAPVPDPGAFFNPVPGGAAVAVPMRPAGSFGLLVQNQQGTLFALTAGHVVQAFQGRIPADIQVFQPPAPTPDMPPAASPLFGATVDGFFGNLPDGEGFLDFALLAADPGRAATSTPLDGGPLVPRVMPASFVVNNRVPMSKFGAASRRTFGEFSAAVGSIPIGGINVTKVLEFKGAPGRLFAEGGDSGAVAVSAAQGSEGVVIGIVIAAAPPTPDAPAGRAFVVPFERMRGIRPA